ncbi:MAG: VOC family protein [Alphaproteobacteria bacterium]|jgi:catechol 2,3-dioxygenase-like lactoylglutathione lyase family enzyme|tara:strand:- start:80 stop:481 length:402 start_codon:yes stop_codon:yes gene_type:complete
MIETKGVCHFTIAVTDTRKSTEFYTDVLGLKLLNANHDRGMVFLDSAGDCIVLMKTDTTIAPVRQRDAHHAFHVEADMFDGCVQELKDKGIEIMLEDERKERAVVTGRSVYIPDPDGNVIELVDMYAYSGDKS